MTDTTPAPTAPGPGPKRRPWYWEDYTPQGTKAGELPPGGDLAALHLGLTLAAGTAPQMWRFYRTPVDGRLAGRGEVSDDQAAEHMTLALFAMHQQSKTTLMHHSGIRFGTAVRALHERFSTEAVASRMSAAAQARSQNAVFFHLRGLLSQLSVISQPIDYTQLLADLKAWPWPDGRSRVIRSWGSDYHAYVKEDPVRP
ncbi:type I-E CRISPR-associated protein Cse2/CasB [Streptomyces sp. G44]|uniref:type I-E CRISPR-associated protein Cse2/CasB n=1 Tax=Streptomyces sp. G44 TaxID=2807632 RepID=UPI001960F5B1|nr:type I-E CRISPR-associated protein Cse2/CasB [Streptomyces sp. G44]MBM7167491.1 type I-E CRISPR-associated protein Cse2/CasB [Streptomyces sp. G44]